MEAVKYATLPTGAKMPLLGLGTWKSKPGEVKASVEYALKNGYKHVDAAYVYGNESEVGEGIAAAFQAGAIKRDELFVTSKLWNSRHRKEVVKSSLKESLSMLQLDYLDLYLIHWPICFKLNDARDNIPKKEDGSMDYDVVEFAETWAALEECVDEGLVKAIGLSNFNSRQIDEVFACAAKHKPAVLQVESHPWLNQEALIAFAQAKGMVVTAYSPLGSPDRPWATEGEPTLLEDGRIKAIADKYNGKTNAQVCIRFQVQRGVVVIPKSVTPARIDANAAVFDFELSEEDMGVLRSFDKGPEGRIVVPRIPGPDGTLVARDAGHPFFPFKAEDPF